MATATTEEQVATATPAPPAAEPAAPPARARLGEWVSAGCALALVAVMFATEWYGVAGVPDPSYARPAISTAENGWNGLSAVRWVLLATIVAAIGSVLLHISQREHGSETDTSRVVAALGALSSLLLIYRVAIELPAAGKVIDQKLGAFLGLACALGIAWGGYESIVEQRARTRADSRRSRRSQRRARTTAQGTEAGGK